MRLGDNNFFSLFQRLASHSNQDRDCDAWSFAGVRWLRQRHIQWAACSYQIETYELEHPGRPRWVLLVVHEIWWGSKRQHSIRNARWVHLESGNRGDVLRWLEERVGELE